MESSTPQASRRAARRLLDRSLGLDRPIEDPYRPDHATVTGGTFSSPTFTGTPVAPTPTAGDSAPRWQPQHSSQALLAQPCRPDRFSSGARLRLRPAISFSMARQYLARLRDPVWHSWNPHTASADAARPSTSLTCVAVSGWSCTMPQWTRSARMRVRPRPAFVVRSITHRYGSWPHAYVQLQHRPATAFPGSLQGVVATAVRSQTIRPSLSSDRHLSRSAAGLC